jgi:hypothetical protein
LRYRGQEASFEKSPSSPCGYTVQWAVGFANLAFRGRVPLELLEETSVDRIEDRSDLRMATETGGEVSWGQKESPIGGFPGGSVAGKEASLAGFGSEQGQAWIQRADSKMGEITIGLLTAGRVSSREAACSFPRSHPLRASWRVHPAPDVFLHNTFVRW